MTNSATMESMTNVEFDSRKIALGIMRADIARMDAQLRTPEAADRRAANDMKFVAMSMGYGLMYTFIVIPAALIAPFALAVLLAPYRTIGAWLGVASWGIAFWYGRYMRQQCDARKVEIEAAFEASMRGEIGYGTRPTTQCSRCLTPFPADAGYCTACGKTA
jgi:hypothetical protein